ncbi:MAG TPA: hypothetical protein DCO68_07515 [Methylophilaceae bacterium]|nr:hypothetical protein [Methylophilaceae bacterium]HAJ71913.1 hypothetical protein [Methylophilaceae bacterium]
MKTSQLSQVLFVCIMLACASRTWWLPSHRVGTTSKTQIEQNWAFAQWNVKQKNLYKLPLSSLEQRFAANFPGHIARFTDGDAILVVRHTTKPTRMLHSALDCYRGLGYQVTQPRVVENNQHQRWRCFNASKGQSLQVCERIFDNQGGQWTDVSAWYWESLFKQNNKEWWAITKVTGINNAI